MNAVEKKKWKNFCVFSVVFTIVLFIVCFATKGFTFEIFKSVAPYASIVIVCNFFWFFCARNING